jgi:hypothetical protein
MSTVRVASQDQAERTAARVAAAQTVLLEQVAALQSGEDWERFLAAQARLHQYSPNNVMLISAQHAQAFAEGRVDSPEVRYVAGFQTWKALGRSVGKGQHGYAVLAPMLTRRKRGADEEAAGRAVGVEDGPTSVEEHRLVLRGFRVEHVFELGQTSGEPIPEPAPPQLLQGEAPVGLGVATAALIEGHGYSVDTVPDAAAIGGANGRTDWGARSVVVRADMDDAAMVKTLLHEAAHVLLHEGAPGRFLDRAVKEVEAESVAFVVAAAHGMRTDGYSFPYVAGWAGRDAVSAVRATQGRVASASKAIIAVSPAAKVSGGKVPGAEAALEHARTAARGHLQHAGEVDRSGIEAESSVVVACRQRLSAVVAEVGEIAEGGGPDFSSVVAEALQGLATELGGAGLLTRSRPGSWESGAVAALAASFGDDWTIGL